MKRTKKLLALVCALSVLSSLTVGCSKKEDAKASNEPAAKQEPFKIKYMLPSYADPIKDDNPIKKYIEEYTNTQLEFIWVPNASYNDKVNITLASSDIPTIMVADPKLSSILNAARNGAFWDITNQLGNYKNLKDANKVVLNNTSIDGKVFGVYRSRPLGRNTVLYRQDWLDAVGMQAPKTTDDFYNVLKAFTTKDPDKNGKDDTYGMVVTKYTGPWNVIQSWFGVPNKWGTDKDGKLVAAHTTDQYITALKYMKKLYDEKLVNADFAVMDSGKWNDPVVNDKAGVIVDVGDRANQLQKAMIEAGKKGTMGLVGTINDKALPTSGYASCNFISKTAVKSDADLKRALDFLDKLNDKEMQNAMSYGVEGRHYTVESNQAVVSTDKTILAEKNDLNQMGMGIPKNYAYTALEKDPVKLALANKVQEVMAANEKFVVANPAEPLISNTYTQKGAQLDTIIDDARIKFIVGQIDEKGLKDAIELWKKSGGDDVTKELNAEYAKIKK